MKTTMKQKKIINNINNLHNKLIKLQKCLQLMINKYKRKMLILQFITTEENHNYLLKRYNYKGLVVKDKKSKYKNNFLLIINLRSIQKHSKKKI